MKILVLGGTGQVGFEVRRSAAILGEIISPNRKELSLDDLEAVEDFLQSTKPDVIINAAAWTAVDRAEAEQDAAYLLNSKLPKLLASYAKVNQILLVHYSSDYVYPGDGGEPWTELSATGPLSVYGASKLQGDKWVQESGCKHFIFRTSWVYSARGTNFLKTMIRLGKEKSELKIVNDQIGSPTSARLIADVTVHAIRQYRDPGVEFGVYNLCPKGEVSWFSFAQEIFSQMNRRGATLKVDQNGLSGIATSDYPTPAKRPLNSRMSVSKLEKTFGLVLPDWKNQLSLVVEELNLRDR